MQPQSELVFVYGTLRRGGSNHSRMDGSTHITHATVKGHLYQVDWYPGLVLDEKGRAVAGEVYAVPSGMIADLDNYEGSEFNRIKGTATNQAGESFEVWIWEWNQSTEGLQEVLSGDWLLVSST